MIDNINDVLEMHRKKICSLEEGIKNLSDQINDLVCKNEFDAVKSLIESNRSSFDLYIQAIQAQGLALNESVYAMKKEFENVKQCVSSFLPSVKALESTITIGLSECQKEYKCLDQKNEKLVLDLNMSIEDKIKSIPSPVIPSSDSIQKDILSKIEGYLLDCKNANVRSMNSDQRIAILEKKVEQLNLLFKKFELSQ